MAVYILEFSAALGNPNKTHGTAKYYLGYCADNRVEERLAEHRAGRGAFITAAAVEKGLELKLVMLIPGAARTEERRLKNMKSHKRVLKRYHQYLVN